MLDQNSPPSIENLLEKLVDDLIPMNRLKTLISKAFITYATHSDILESSEDEAYEIRRCLFRLLDRRSRLL